MLRSSRLQTQVVKPFVCWKCSTRSATAGAVAEARSAYRNYSRRSNLQHVVSKRNFNSGRAYLATVETQSNISDAPSITSPGLAFRESLRQWEKENIELYKPAPEKNDRIRPDQTVNTLTRQQGGEMTTAPDEMVFDDDASFAFSPDQLVNVGNNRSFLLPGDLVELMAIGSRQQELAIFVRHVEFQAQYYTMSGRWVHRSQASPKFFVPEFVKPEELLPLLPYLPNEPIAQEDLEKLHGFNVALPRNVGRPIILKMSKFWADADAVYQGAFERLDKAHNILAHPDRFSYATLEQITEKLLSRGTRIKKDEAGKYPMHVLYAVHRKILGEDVGFQPQDIQIIRTGAFYEISSKAEILAIRTTMDFVRKYRAALVTKNFSTCTPFVDFLKKARRRIDFSRTFRDFTPHGTIGPSTLQSEDAEEHYRVGRKGDPWNDNDFEFLDFMESWSCLQSISRNSILTGIGSEILRALGRYKNVELNLTTAFTFLKEVGVIPPWENRAAYILRLPYTGRRLGVEYGYTPHTGYTADKLAHIRKDWRDLPVYCIDDHSAHEIDDGISIEATGKPNEYWIHVHVADPAAHMDPNGAAAQYAEYVTETIYFPERRVPMLHGDKVSQDLSLAPNRPCLTFSSKINLDGEVIEHTITPGIIRNVLYVEPELVHRVTTNLPAKKYKIYGEVADDAVISNLSGRSLLNAESLSDAQKKDLATIYKISAARTDHWANKGGVTLTPDRPMVRVSFDGAPWTKPESRHSYWRYGDPKILVAVPEEEYMSTQFSIVAACMLIAGECAAHWSAERGLPITYRVTPQHPDKDPSRYFEEHVRPYRDKGENIPVKVLGDYFNTIGKVQPSAVPGPHLGIGADSMTRCTSPLRRYSDLMVMWQIEAALLEEARTGGTLVGNTREDFLPFTKAKIESMLPRISYREKFISHGMARADRFWTTQFLVYAWKFGKYAKLPSPLYYKVRSVNLDNKTVGGVLVDLQIGGQMPIPRWIKLDDCKIDDRFEVEIEKIDVVSQVVVFNAVRRIEKGGQAVDESESNPGPQS